MRDVPDRLKLMGDTTRWRVVQFLAQPIRSCRSRDDGVCGCDLVTFLEGTRSTVSHHMKLLVDAGLVTAERRGRWVYDELDPGAFQELASAPENVARAAKRSHGEKVSA